nr:peptidyl-prolyl cis-trans isomerase CYP38, chloroplastic [Tanacetum cinerariifolium]
MIIAGLAESKKDHAIELLAKLEVGMDKLHKITEDRKREAIVPKQKELLEECHGPGAGSSSKAAETQSPMHLWLSRFLPNAIGLHLFHYNA